jgi:hypothetical protein
VDECAAEFMGLLGKGNVTEAYHVTAPVFQVTETASSFEGRIRELGISRFASQAWTGKAEQAEKTVLSGKLKTRTGREFSMDLELIRDAGSWSVSSFKFRSSEELPDPLEATRSGNLSFSETGQTEMPSAAEVKHLSRQNLATLAKCAASGDFTEFYDSISAIWQSQVSVVRLQRAFGKLAEQGGDLDWVSEAEVQLLEPPVLNQNGLLIIQGRVEGPMSLEFLFRYNYELPHWKLFGVEATLAPLPDPGASPQ